MSDSFESKVAKRIKENGKCRIWVDYVLESYSKGLKESKYIISFHMPRQIGSIGTITQYNEKKKDFDTKLWKGLCIGYVDLTTTSHKDRNMLVDALLLKAKRFKSFPKRKELEGKGV